jgi:hypothetical protein
LNDKIQRTGFSLVLLFIGVVLAPGDGAATEKSILIEDVTSDQGVHGLRATFHLQASRDAIWALLTDYDRFKETFKARCAGTLYDQSLDTHLRVHAAKGLRATIRVDNLASHRRGFSRYFRRLDDLTGTSRTSRGLA